jgi:hypothetical protein
VKSMPAIHVILSTRLDKWFSRDLRPERDPHDLPTSSPWHHGKSDRVIARRWPRVSKAADLTLSQYHVASKDFDPSREFSQHVP